jgi:RNA polymerase sigma factor (TIGR02999 family)
MNLHVMTSASGLEVLFFSGTYAFHKEIVVEVECMDSDNEATRLLQSLADGDAGAVDLLLPLVYDELRNLASRRLKSERPDHTLQATALVHEAYMQLVDASNIDFKGRAHFFALAARVVRQVLIQHARAHDAQKRGGDRRKITLVEGIAISSDQEIDLMDLDEALTKLAAVHERQARVVELRFFGGLSVEEVATLLDVSERTVKGDWKVARAWLRSKLGGGGRGAR